MKRKKKKATKKVEPNKKPSSQEEKVFDIASPGKSIPSASGRPIIVSHKPNVSDPMVAPTTQKTESEKTDEKSDTPSAGEGAEMVMAAPKKNRIEPLHTDIKPDAVKEGTDEEEKKEGPNLGEPAEAPAADSVQDTDQPKDNEASEEIADAANEVTTKKQAQSEAAKQEAEAAKRQAEVDALINNKQFFVPINAVQKRRSMKLVIFLLVLILILLGFLIAWDAEVFNLGAKAPTDFF